jgi:hypothetical protein
VWEGGYDSFGKRTCLYSQVDRSPKEGVPPTNTSSCSVAYRGGGGVQPPGNSEVLTKLSRIPSSVEITSVHP